MTPSNLEFDLASLLGNSPQVLVDQPLLLCDAAIDQPVHYLFEAVNWSEVIGAGRQLMSLRSQWAKALPIGSVAIRLESDRLVALLPIQNKNNEDWPAALAQITTAISGGVLMLNIGTIQLTASQALNGLYRTPTRVIGIPGMTDHQGRINHYYGVDNPSTLPSPERIATQRQFGEALNLVMSNRQRAADSRLAFPFYECLPLYVRCPVCQARPVDSAANGYAAQLCAICARKRRFAEDATDLRRLSDHYVLIAVGIPGAERLFLNQPTPGAYNRMAITLDEIWRRAVQEAEKIGALSLWQSGTTAWFIAPPDTALNVAVILCAVFAARDQLALGKPIIGIGMAVGSGDNRTVRAQFDQAQNALAHAITGAQRDRDSSPGAICLATNDLNGSDRFHLVIDPDHLRYTPETISWVDEAAHNFAASGFPTGLLSHLSLQETTQSANLAYQQIRTRLTEPQRQQLDKVARELEPLWGVGTTRFFKVLHDIQVVLDQINADQRQPGINRL